VVRTNLSRLTVAAICLIADIRDSAVRRCARIRAAREAGLTTVEIALLTAVVLGLAGALAAAITAVVNRNVGKIK
jgi:hypothetical protein